MRVETQPRRDDFVSFMNACDQRLAAGAKEYGGVSFSRTPESLLGEIEEELMDVCGWAFILFSRLQRVREALFVTDLDDELEDYLPNENDTGEHGTESKKIDLPFGDAG